MTLTNFLTLPRELRDKIYDQCFYEGIVVIPHSKSASMGLLQVCRQVYDESIPYFYARNIFNLSLDAKDPEDRYTDWPEQQKILESHLSRIQNLNIRLFVGHYDEEEQFKGAREKFQWIVDTLIRTDENRGELLLKELFIKDFVTCYCEEPNKLAHTPDKAADLHLEAARELYQKPLEALKRRVGVQTIKLTLVH